mmetsp:Transcript_46393/g.73252  ORF Transcript_46393/g.73252 Transcript_46393/m.73252 type:complete len:209 (-) Transcript_46393:127-753(-)
MAPVNSSSRTRSPLSPIKRNPFGPRSTKPYIDANKEYDKENTHCAGWANGVVYEASPDKAPILVDMCGSVDVADKPVLRQRTGQLGHPLGVRPSIPEKSTSEVRLCTELARQSLVPAGVILFVFCILCIAHVDEDHSPSAIRRLIARSMEDFVGESEEANVTAFIVVGLTMLVLVGIVCTYMCQTCGAAESRKSKRKQDRSNSRTADF